MELRRIFAFLLVLAGSLSAQDYLVLTQTNTAYADAVSRKLWNIVRPDAQTNTNLVTKRFCGWLVNTDGRVALLLPATIKLHPAADADDLPDSIAAAVTPQEREQLRADIVANRGKLVIVKDFIPASRKLGAYKTKAELLAEGGWPSQ